MSNWIMFGLSVTGGYVLAVFTWQPIHTFFIGAAEKAAALREKARALEAKLRAP